MNPKVCLITGASRGIGREIAKQLALNNYTVIADYNNSEKEAFALQSELTEQGKSIDLVKCDVTKRNQVEKMIEYILEKFHRIDLLVNNAGISQEKMFQDITDEDFDEIINADLYSVYCVTQNVISTMINQKSGSIINISSIYGVNGGSFASMYSASKAGVIGLTKSLAKELGPSNIRVNAIAPGFIDTDMNKNLSEEEKNETINEIPLNKIGDPIDIAKCVLWLVEDEYTTGQVINIDGGWMM